MPPGPWPAAAALLVPSPTHLELTDETFPIPRRLTAAWRGPTGRRETVVARLNEELRRAGQPAVMIGLQPCDLHIEIDPHTALDPEGYRLRIDSRGISIEAGTAAGVFYGVCTLAQWIRIHRLEGRTDITGRVTLTGVKIRDRPDFPHRGVMLDVSRDKVPKIEELQRLIDRLAGWKINQVQLYMEHTFAYANHESVWSDASPYTAEDLRDLDAFCRERFIELVPNQNSFGHFHRWLVHDRYRPLAEVPGGVEHPFTLEEDTLEPFSLCPTDPETLRLLESLYDELLPCFESGLFNVGLDETFDLGTGRSAASCEERGQGRVYLEFLQEIHRRVRERDRRMLFWGDVILQRPELIEELPEDAVALEWGYEADHPFDEDGARFAAAEREFWVCPGTSSWNSLAGRWTNARRNLASAARRGKERGARGYLITDWGDHGHLQAPFVSRPGFLVGAAFAWNTESADKADDLPVARWLDVHVFDDEARRIGRMVLDLGDLYLAPGPEPPQNGSALFFQLIFAGQKRQAERIRGVHREGWESVLEQLDEIASRQSEARIGRDDAEWIHEELSWTIELLRIAARMGLNDAPASLADRLDIAADRGLDLASRRCREGGLVRGVARLRRAGAVLRT